MEGEYRSSLEVHEAKLREARRKDKAQLERIAQLQDSNATLGTCVRPRRYMTTMIIILIINDTKIAV
jgi:hypothetical protein